ncbi:phasin family protein [Methylorubrum zatmanii]|uniref:Phasin family protein n=1 Tax=Methylorubrum zatmanii TaxID=29429 RepID=A0ABW1WUI3_9HYPH|nr:phasin family protein [Methylorubrum zatmanii]MBD8905742.1 Phasin [Methylorubrum zatmanii]
MSSSRRRGRPPGTSASTVPPTAVPQPEGTDIPAFETSATEGAQPQGAGQETGQEAVTEFVSEGQDSAEETALAARLTESVSPEAVLTATEEKAQPEITSVETASAEADSAQAASGPVETAPADTPADSLAAEPEPEADPAAEAAAPAPESPPVEIAAQDAERIEQAAESVVEAVVPAEAVAAVTKAAPRSVRIGASFAFAPSFVPLTEINAKLFAFARGEGEAALAHFQALTRAKSPAEAIRLQVTELQRAADASLTCFNEIVRSANRLSEAARWH